MGSFNIWWVLLPIAFILILVVRALLKKAGLTEGLATAGAIVGGLAICLIAVAAMNSLLGGNPTYGGMRQNRGTSFSIMPIIILIAAVISFVIIRKRLR